MEKLGSRKWLKVCTLFIAGVLLLFLGGCGKNSSNSPAFNISGSWFVYDATNTIQGEQGPRTFAFQTSDTTLNGTTPGGMLLTGTTTDAGVNFSWTDTPTGIIYTYSGTVGVNGATIQGTWSTNTQNGPTGTWIGLFYGAPSVGSIPGAWSLTTVGAGSQGTFDITFTQSNNDIIITTTPGGPQNTHGTICYLNLAFFVTGSDGTTYTYVGTVTPSATTPLTATAMSGTWTNTNGASGTWSAAQKS